MNLVCEANRNSALFSTMQNVLEVVNPLVTKERPTVVNESKEKIQVQPSNWGNTWSDWNGSQTLTFDIPRMGPMTNFNLSVAFKLPGEVYTTGQYNGPGSVNRYMGMADPLLTTGNLINTNDGNNTARGRLDRVYADHLLGFNMIQSYKVLSKTKEIFSAPGEYLLLRFNQLPTDVKDAVYNAITPVRHDQGPDKGYYGPGITYLMKIPLWFFFNEHISHAIDVNFTESVRIEIKLRQPQDLFWYGNLGSLQFLSDTAIGQLGDTVALQYVGNIAARKFITWDQSTTQGSRCTVKGAATFDVTTQVTRNNTCIDEDEVNATGREIGTNAYADEFGTVNVGGNANSYTNVSGVVTPSAFQSTIDPTAYAYMINKAWGHTLGLCAPLAAPQVSEGNPKLQISITNEAGAGKFICGSEIRVGNHYPWAPPRGNVGYCTSGPTFRFPNVDNRGKSPQVIALGYAYFLIQDTDAARALRAQQFPEGSGFTSLPYNVSHEVFKDIFRTSRSDAPLTSMLSIYSGGHFDDGRESNQGVSALQPGSFVDCVLRDNHLVTTTSFMVRKQSDLGGDMNPHASVDAPLIGRWINTTAKKVGAHHIYSRCLPIQHFQIRAAGRVIYESDGDSHLLLDQSIMYPGTRLPSYDKKDTFDVYADTQPSNDISAFGHVDRASNKPFFIYTINWGLLASRLQHTGALSLQNLNQPTLRIYFRSDDWSEFCTDTNSQTYGNVSEAMVAASLGVRVDVVHEHYNVLTINSGNGEITTGLNQ